MEQAPQPELRPSEESRPALELMPYLEVEDCAIEALPPFNKPRLQARVVIRNSAQEQINLLPGSGLLKVFDEFIFMSAGYYEMAAGVSRSEEKKFISPALPSGVTYYLNIIDLSVRPGQPFHLFWEFEISREHLSHIAQRLESIPDRSTRKVPFELEVRFKLFEIRGQGVKDAFLRVGGAIGDAHWNKWAAGWGLEASRRAGG
ncbi:MAG: hypothetical protein HY684_04695 [Chloroflexi bacterium]|nr:hypothetical protein [Chloroflexota bacterium]